MKQNKHYVLRIVLKNQIIFIYICLNCVTLIVHIV